MKSVSVALPRDDRSGPFLYRSYARMEMCKGPLILQAKNGADPLKSGTVVHRRLWTQNGTSISLQKLWVPYHFSTGPHYFSTCRVNGSLIVPASGRLKGKERDRRRSLLYIY